MTEIEDKISSITGLDTTAALNAVENNLPNISNLVKKTYYGEKYQTLNLNILQHLVIINLRMKYLIKR